MSAAVEYVLMLSILFFTITTANICAFEWVFSLRLEKVQCDTYIM